MLDETAPTEGLMANQTLSGGNDDESHRAAHALKYLLHLFLYSSQQHPTDLHLTHLPCVPNLYRMCFHPGGGAVVSSRYHSLSFEVPSAFVYSSLLRAVCHSEIDA